MQAEKAYTKQDNQVVGIVHRNICTERGLDPPRSRWETPQKVVIFWQPRKLKARKLRSPASSPGGVSVRLKKSSKYSLHRSTTTLVSSTASPLYTEFTVQKLFFMASPNSKSIINLRPKVSWYQGHMWTPSCSTIRDEHRNSATKHCSVSGHGGYSSRPRPSRYHCRCQPKQ